MDTPVRVCGRTFMPALIQHLVEMITAQPGIGRGVLAKEVCHHLDWYSPNGRPAISSARVALRKLENLGLFRLRKTGHSAVHRLKPSGQKLPAVVGVPRRVDEVRGLFLYLICGQEDRLHGLWNDLMIQQHPCRDAPLVGTQLRYLIGSDHGWLGALGFGPAAFLLGARDQWMGWSTRARLEHLREVVCLSRLLIRQEVRCTNLVSKTWSLVVSRLAEDWYSRYGARPLLVETFIDRSRFTGRSLAAANWMRLGESRGQGRLGPRQGCTTAKDIWVYPLAWDARRQLQNEPPESVQPCSLQESLETADWCSRELETIDLGDVRLNSRARKILLARWNDPSATFGASFPNWAGAKGAYNLIENQSPQISLQTLLSPHAESSQARMAVEPVVLLAQDTTSLNYSGLKQTTGLGEIGSGPARGLFLHSLLALRTDGVLLGVLDARSWGRCPAPSTDQRTRNAKSIDEKESCRWMDELRVSAAAARRLPRTQMVVLADREGDLYELHDGVQIGPPNLHVLVRAQHDRNLDGHQKLWAFLAAQPLGERRDLRLPRRGSRAARMATVEMRWASVTIQAPAVGPKKGWPSLTVRAVWVHEPAPPPGIEPLDWMLLTDLPVSSGAAAWEKVQWYCRRWGIEEWHRVLKSICKVEQREFKSAEHLQRVLAFDLIMAWRILALVKLGRAVPNVPASLLYTEEELEVLTCAVKKKLHHLRRS
jgi:Druantia protein DruA/Transposase DNA-binding